jgi:hypothetical protein
MSYRNIEVNGETYQFTVGKTHTKIRGFCAVLNENIGTKVEVPYTDGYGRDAVDIIYEVRPKNVADYIKLKTNGKTGSN